MYIVNRDFYRRVSVSFVLVDLIIQGIYRHILPFVLTHQLLINKTAKQR